MEDNYGRKITYMRISVTDKCNLRCRYCMPLNGNCKKEHDEMMTEEELINLVEASTKLGIKKIRLTGGEPLVKKNIVSIVKNIKMIDGIEEVCITTNGVKLNELSENLKLAGLDRINISIDSLIEDKYKYITGGGNLQDALNGLNKALDTGFKKIKINTVLIGGFNDDEVFDFIKLTIDKPIDCRFIELMPMYDSGDFKEDAFISYKTVLEKVKKYELIEINSDNGVAKLYKLKNAKGNIGFISPVSNHFCNECNRIRVTADGKIKPCLHSNQEISIKGLSKNEMFEKLKMAILSKPEKHDELSFKERSKANRNMNQIGG